LADSLIRLITGYKELATINPKQSIGNNQSATINPKQSIGNNQSATINPKQSIWQCYHFVSSNSIILTVTFARFQSSKFENFTTCTDTFSFDCVLSKW